MAKNSHPCGEIWPARCSSSMPVPPTTKYSSTSSPSRMARFLPPRSGSTPSTRSVKNGRLAAQNASTNNSQMEADCVTESGAEHLHDRLGAQRHQAARQDAEDQHQRAIDRQHDA